MTLSLEHHQVQLRYTAVRSTSPSKERRVLSSLAEIGQQCPVVVVVDRAPRHYVLIDGYKRMRALSKLHCDTVVASCWELSEADALIMERLLSRPRSDGPLEQGWLLSELKVRFGLSHHELACRFAVSESWVSRRLALVQQAPDFVQRAVREGRIVAHAAMKYLVPLARAKTDDARRLCEAIAPLSLSSRQVGALYAAYQQADAKGCELILEFDSLNWPQSDPLNWPHPDQTSSSLMVAKLQAAGGRNDQGGVIRSYQTRLFHRGEIEA
jgi:ParB family chromosome partitioning protein